VDPVGPSGSVQGCRELAAVARGEGVVLPELVEQRGHPPPHAVPVVALLGPYPLQQELERALVVLLLDGGRDVVGIAGLAELLEEPFGGARAEQRVEERRDALRRLR